VTQGGQFRLSLDKLSLRAGYAWTVQDFEIAPYLAAAARWQDTGSFVETGAGIFSLSVASSTLEQYEIGPGVRLSSPQMAFEGFAARASLDLAYAHLSGDRAHETTASLLGTSIRARTAEVGEHVFKVGSEIEVTGSNGRSSGVLSYDGRFQDNATAHTVTAGFRLAF
jgi:uncharacterized protein with beta-barrel porin domain